jgi:hypothetical protein
MEITGTVVEKQPVLDGVSLLPLIEGRSEQRSRPLGFWDTPRAGISTPSAKWMKELLEAQEKGGDLKPHPSSLEAAELPEPRHPLDSFPGHAAWIKGDWKLHRIQAGRGGAIKWELYDLANDRKEAKDLFSPSSERARSMQGELDGWLKSVARSLNGEDY